LLLGVILRGGSPPSYIVGRGRFEGQYSPDPTCNRLGALMRGPMSRRVGGSAARGSGAPWVRPYPSDAAPRRLALVGHLLGLGCVHVGLAPREVGLNWFRACSSLVWGPELTGE
jgi:hypothetical protein